MNDNAVISIPKGQLVAGDDGTLTAMLRLSRPARKTMREWFERLVGSRPRRVLTHSRLEDGPRGFEIHFEPQPRDAISLATAIKFWRIDPQTSIPIILDLGRFVFEVAGELAGRGFGDTLVAPTTIRHVPDSPEPWRLVPLSTSGLALADWARAEPNTWLWNTSETVVAGAALDPVHLLGTALHHGLAGAITPELLSNRAAFARVLRGRTGLHARLGHAIRLALPRSLEDDAAALERLVLDCIEAAPALRPRPASARERFEELARKLATERLIRYWGFENQAAVISRLSALSNRTPVPTPGEPSPKSTPTSTPAVSWDEQVPKLVARGDLAGALEASWNDIQENGPYRIRFYLAIVQRIAARRPGTSTEVSEAIDRLVAEFKDQLDESDILRLAHIRTRHLGERADRLGIAHRKFESRWNDAIARLMQARLLLATGQAYNQVSRLCNEARGLYALMPERGGKAGLYATAYLQLLDGIAHIGAVSLYKNDSFYKDAFECFGRALELAGKIGDDELIRSCLGWIGWLGRFTSIAHGPPLSLLSAGIDAVLRSHGLTAESVAASGVPVIPWYDEARLFPV
jgi:hypothetical protein